MGVVDFINLAVPELSTARGVGLTGIAKRPVAGPVLLRAPGPKGTGLGSGVVGDRVLAMDIHGGDDQAVYAYAREDLGWWQGRLGRELGPGLFGENLTTSGVDVNAALVGERWRVGAEVILEAVLPRIPCATFAAKMGEKQWIKTFTDAARPGPYLRVVRAGYISAGDEITVVHRPSHDLSIAVLFRALTTEPSLLPEVVAVAEVPAKLRAKLRAKLALRLQHGGQAG